MSRLLRHARRSYGNLGANREHTFAQRHALNIYPSDAIYSLIPKNACSTMRTSLAVVNGCIRDGEDFNWIHQNNDTFAASLSDLAKAKYTFVILRCPYSRLASVYLDKFLNRDPIVWRYIDLHRREIGFEDITFEFFVNSLREERIRHGDIHWTPQAAFLVYEEYDDYFALENFSAVAETLKRRIDLDLVDARPLTKHGREGYRALTIKEPFRIEPFELLALRRDGYLPTLESMYTDELVRSVADSYEEDLDLYKREFGADNLLFA